MRGRTLGAITRKKKWLVITPTSGVNKMEYFSSCNDMKKIYDLMYPNLLKLLKQKTAEGRPKLRKKKDHSYDNMLIYKLK